MNRPNLRPFNALAVAILLFLAFSSAVYAQSVNYAITGTLNLTSGSDPLKLQGDTVVAQATLSQAMSGVGSSTAASSTNTYTFSSAGGVTVTITGSGGNPATVSCSSGTSVTLTDVVGGPDTIQINNCSLTILGFAATISATATLPDGNMSTAVPAAITATSITGTVNYSLSYKGSTTNGAFGLTNGGITATGALPPAITPNPAAWTPAAVQGSTVPLSQAVSLSAAAAVSFTTSATTTSGGNWLSVTPVEANTLSPLTVTANPSGLLAGSYSGTVTLTDQLGVTTQISVTFSITAPATLTVPTTPLTFNYTLGGTVPLAQSVSISGTSGINFTTAASTTTGGSWLSATPSGTVPSSIGVSLNQSVLSALTTAGTYSGSVTVTSTGAVGSPASIPVTLNVIAPVLTAGLTPLNFTYQIGSTAPIAQSISVGDPSGVTFTATAATNPAGGSWLSVTPASGNASGAVQVSINTSGLTAKTYNGTITIAATGAVSQVVNVTLVVTQPTITVGASSVSFAYQTGGTTPPAQQVSIGGTSGLAFTAAAGAGTPWLLVSPSGGSISNSSSVNISVNTSGLAAKTYNGTVTIAAAGATSQPINVTLVVSSTPTISASPGSLSFTYQIGKSAPAAQPVGIGGSSGLSVTATAATNSGGSWLSVTPSGVTPASISVSVTPSGLTANTYTGTITIAASGVTSQTVNVSLVVSNGPTITLSASSLSFKATTGAAIPAAQTVNVTSSAPSPVTVSTSGGSWLTATSSASTTPAIVTVSANQTNLSAGTYSGSVFVTSAGASNTPQTISVQFVVSAPTTITATPASLSFAYVLGGANPPSQSISVTSTGPATFSASIATGSWLTLTTSSASTPSTLTLSVSPSSLAAGTYNTTVSIAGAGIANSPVIIPVSLVVSNKPTLAASPSSLTFSGSSGGANPASQSVALSGSGALTFTIATSPSWLGVSAASSTTPAVLVVTVNSKGMTQGSYQGTIAITSASAGNSPVTIPVALNISAPLVIPGPTVSAVVSGASYDSSGFAAGTIVTIFGSLLGPQTGATFSVNSKGSLDTTLDGATVTVGGVPAIPLFVQGGQVNIILPFGLAASGQVPVEVKYNDLTSADFNIPLTAADVQIFTADASGSGPGSILNQDYSVNTAANPAAPGSVVQVYGTGGGALNPPVIAGNVAGDTLSLIALAYSATVNGEAAKVLYAGSAPGLVYGVYQFNVQLPADVKAGSAKIVLKVGDSTSQPDVTVFVK
jgi:uncharacterized protein (TIGR03437 family)